MAENRHCGKITQRRKRGKTVADEQQALHAVVHGRVQGVSFRYYTTQRAGELGVIGWVRNLPDGTVEVLAEGTQTQLDQFLMFLHRGPVGARVSSVNMEWQSASGKFDDFTIR
jgi:acylphosphatase